MTEARTWGLVAEQHGVAVGELRVRMAGRVTGASDSRHLRNSAAAQLVQHERRVVVLLRLLVIGLDAAHKVQLRPAHTRSCPFTDALPTSLVPFLRSFFTTSAAHAHASIAVRHMP